MNPSSAAMRSTEALAVVPVESPGTERAFRELPYRLYHDDAYWAPPLRFEETRRWSPRHHASLRYRWSRRFLAVRGGRTVGRIAAIVDDDFARRWGAGTGFFGFFECENDPAAARALLDATEETLRERRMEHVIGPVNLTTHDETGRMRGYVGQGRFTDDSLETFGGAGVVEIPRMQTLLRYICEEGFEHHVAANLSSTAPAVDEAASTYLGWDMYHHA